MSTLLHDHLETPGQALPAVGKRLREPDFWLEVYGRAHLPTEFGEFEILVFRNSMDELEHLALVRGIVQGRADVPVRIHSECLTGDVLGSLRCDCREQLHLAMAALGKAKNGLLLYLRQEGRGIGLGNKVRAYALQEQGLDTYAANRHLGFDDDLRDYRVAAAMLKLLGPASIRLVTNNPRKIFGLRQRDIAVSSRVPVVGTTNIHNADYLAAKVKAGHLLGTGER